MPTHKCRCCGDPATIVKEIKERFWPFKLIDIIAYCYDCHREVVYKQLPKLTDSPYQSRRGSGMQKRKRYF